MGNSERKALAPKIFWRYVDDTFIIIKRDSLNEFHRQLNNFDPHNKFSIELESTSGTLPFLNCMTHNNGHKLKTTIYQKPTDSGAILAYSSSHLKSVYASIASSMFRWAKALFTEEADRAAAQIEVKKNFGTIWLPTKFDQKTTKKITCPTSQGNKRMGRDSGNTV